MKLPVFFTPEMVADSGSFSPSAKKPALVVADWQRRGLPLEITSPAPVSPADLALAHDRRYVDRVLSCRTDNGFGNRSPAIAASLPFTTGAMLAAATHVLGTRSVACAPVSGFHHARWDRASGFCTFNGLVVTACALRRDRRAERIGILDCDMHVGDGTEQILKQLGLGPWITHYTAGLHFDAPAEAPRFLEELPRIVESMRGVDVVLYQAGADPHVADPLGGFLTTEELATRDRIVFTTLARLRIPVAWNLAGGYQQEPDGSIPKVLAIHENTARAALAAFG
jgi:acetoin utilization deacetylase AcuC-like enzyme